MIQYNINLTYSIVIPHYNSPDLLARMLKSIPEREDIQVIVVDDCSKADEVSKLQSLQHKNLELYLQSENHGAGYARNVGLDHAKGKWVLVVDADDRFTEGAFDVLDKYKDEGIDYLCYRIQILDSMGNPQKNNFSENSVEAYLRDANKKNTNLFKYRNLVCWNKMVSMDFIRKYNIRFEECQVNNDVYYNLMIGLYAKSYKAIPDILYNPIGQPDSIVWKKRNVQREFQFFIQAQKRNGFYKRLGLSHWPYYRHTVLYLPHILRKHGLMFTLKFFSLCLVRRADIANARSAYLHLFG